MIRLSIGTRNQAEREQWLRNTLADIAPGSRILDAGAGEQANRKYCPHLDYVAQDFGKYDGLGDTAGLQTGKWNQNALDIVSDITAIPEPDASFDAVMCIEVLEHLPRPLLAIREFSRLLRPGGTLVLTAPFCSLTHFSPYHYYSGFNRAFYEAALEECGFELIQALPNGNFFHFVAQELSRASQVVTRYCGGNPGFAWKVLLLAVLWFLQRWSSRDNGSAELLSFGYHVLARKREQAGR